MLKDTGFAPALLKWYARHRRPLPWRSPDGTGASPYAVLISELMLQQTQVATVIPYFLRFIEMFPTVAHLAAADEQKVLRAWQGLGYYSRARNLQSSARKIVSTFGGVIPSTVDELLTLPGIGRYTAGAVASIAYGQPAPIVDGNVTRVLCRLDKIESDPAQPQIRKKLWERAHQLLPPRKVAQFNSALMELGAMVCTPRNPKCLICPVQEFCEAAQIGLQDSIPKPAVRKPTPLSRRWTICLNHNDRWLIEQRPPTGRWAGMWQFITIDAQPSNPTSKHIHQHIGCPSGKPKKIGSLAHALTHRRYEFDVFIARAKNDALGTPARARRWARLEELNDYPLPAPTKKSQRC